MAEKRILLAEADPQLSVDLCQALGQQWEVTLVATGTAAVAELRQDAYDVLLADLDLPELDGAELVNQALKKSPQTIRFLLAKDADREQVIKRVPGAHQVLSKPVDHEMLQKTIESALAADAWIASDRLRELTARVRAFPTIPSLYLEVLAALRSPDATTEQVAEIIAKDMAMMTKLLQVINSAYFGLQRRISDPAEAVGLLGFETVKSMVMSVKFLSQYNKLKPGYFSVEHLWRHSTDVARIARELVLLETKDRGLASEAFTAGLLHDLGKVVLAANFDEQYSGAHSLARKQQIPLWEIEKEIFGASHGEIGAYVFGMWGMPREILEAAALHHDPSRSKTTELSPLAAVHVANVLECEATPGEEGLIAPKLDEAFLAAIGCLDRVPLWREAVRTGDFTNPELKAKPAENERHGSMPPVPTTPPPPRPGTTLPTSSLEAAGETVAEPDHLAAEPEEALITRGSNAIPGPAPAYRQKRWLYAAAVAVPLLLLAVWLVNMVTTKPALVNARTPETNQPVAVAPFVPAAQTESNTPSPATALAAVPETVTNQPLPKPPTESTPAPQPVVVSPPVTNPAPALTTTSPPSTPNPAQKEVVFPELRLQGIIYATSRPSAIINGSFVRIGDLVRGASVVAIGRTNVTLQLQGQRKTYMLE